MQDLETLQEELQDIDMSLLYATGENREELKRMRKNILYSIHKINEKIWATRSKRRYFDEDYWDW